MGGERRADFLRSARKASGDKHSFNETVKLWEWPQEIADQVAELVGAGKLPRWLSGCVKPGRRLPKGVLVQSDTLMSLFKVPDGYLEKATSELAELLRSSRARVIQNNLLLELAGIWQIERRKSTGDLGVHLRSRYRPNSAIVTSASPNYHALLAAAVQRLVKGEKTRSEQWREELADPDRQKKRDAARALKAGQQPISIPPPGSIPRGLNSRPETKKDKQPEEEIGSRIDTSPTTSPARRETNQGLAARGDLADRRRLFGGREFVKDNRTNKGAPNPVRSVEASVCEQEADPTPTMAAAAAPVLPAVIWGRPAVQRLAAGDQLALGFDDGSGPVPFWRRSENYELFTEERVAQLAAERVRKSRQTYDEQMGREWAHLKPRPLFGARLRRGRSAGYIFRCREGRGRGATQRTIFLGTLDEISLDEARSRARKCLLELKNRGRVTLEWRQGLSGVFRTHQGVGGAGDAG